MEFVKIKNGEKELMVRMSEEQFELLEYLSKQGCLPEDLRFSLIEFDILD